MSIQRFDSDDYDVELPEKEDGIYVLYADHVAAVAEQKVMDLVAIEALQNSTLNAAREAVAALSIDGSVWVLRHEALAAIDALRGES